MKARIWASVKEFSGLCDKFHDIKGSVPSVLNSKVLVTEGTDPCFHCFQVSVSNEQVLMRDRGDRPLCVFHLLKKIKIFF